MELQADLKELTQLELTISLIISAIIIVLYTIALWKVFTKAGEKGWKAIIPFYNTYILVKLCWDTKYFWYILALSILSSVADPTLYGIKEEMWYYIILLIIQLVLCVFLLVYVIKAFYYFAKSFGKGVGFAVGLFLLEIVFLPILGFGKSQYVGNEGLKANK